MSGHIQPPKLLTLPSASQEFASDLDAAALLARNLAIAHSRFRHHPAVQAVCTVFGVNICTLLGRSRKEHIVYPRQAAMYMCREVGCMTYEEIGDLFQRDHGTAIWACRAVRARMATDKRHAAVIHAMIRAVRDELDRHQKIIDTAASTEQDESAVQKVLP